MSDLSKMGIDPNVPENEGIFSIVPSGKYKAVIIGTNVKDTIAKDGKIFIVRCQIVEGEYKGFLIREDTINIRNKSNACQERGQGTLKRLCRLTKVPLPFPPSDTTLMHGKPLMLTIGVEEYIDKKSDEKKKSNVILAYNEFQPVQEQSVDVGNNKVTTIDPDNANVASKSIEADEEDPW